MTEDEAIALVTEQAQTDLDPALTSDQVYALVLRFMRAAVWQPGHAYSYGARVTPTRFQGYIYTCVYAGTSGTAEPFFPGYGNSYDWPASTYLPFRGNLTDGTALWQMRAVGVTELYDTTRAIYQAWLDKAAIAAQRVNFSADGSSQSWSDLQAHCLVMADRYKPVII